MMTKEEKWTTAEWVKFFTAAGIPDEESANYAVTFFQNRIRVDMLMDLCREHLNDMGIKLMGDVIAILKHAKLVYALNARDKALTVSSTTAATTSGSVSSKEDCEKEEKEEGEEEEDDMVVDDHSDISNTSITVTSRPRHSTPASRVVHHHLGSDPDARPLSDDSPKRRVSVQPNSSSSSPALERRRWTPRTLEQLQREVDTGRKTSPDLIVKLDLNPGPSMVRTLAVKSRLRHSNPDIRQQSGIFGLPSETVDRLKKFGSKKTATLSLAERRKLSKEPSDSVFSRLGLGLAKRPAAREEREEEEDSVGSPLQYAGVFKYISGKAAAEDKAKKRRRMSECTQGSESQKVTSKGQGFFRSSSFDGAAKAPVKQRLGFKPTGNKAASKQSRPASKPNSGIKNRLGQR